VAIDLPSIKKSVCEKLHDGQTNYWAFAAADRDGKETGFADLRVLGP